MNTVQITGNLAKAPVIRATKTGKAVASFSVGVSKKITKAKRYATRSYDTPDGQRRYITEVVANMIAKPIGRNMKASDVPISGGVRFEDMGTVSQEPSEYEQGEIPF